MTSQGTLFDIPEPKRHDCVHDGPCRTCGAMRPDDYDRHMWLEPVSQECGTCNYATLREIMFGPDREAAWRRHNPKGRRR